MSSSYVMTFRSNPDRSAGLDEEAAWGAWFGELGEAVTDFGHRVGQTRMVGNDPAGDSGARDVLSGYVVITAADLDAAEQLARGCPGLRTGGRVEVGEAIDPA